MPGGFYDDYVTAPAVTNRESSTSRVMKSNDSKTTPNLIRPVDANTLDGAPFAHSAAKPTLSDVAKVAGVSRRSAGAVLNGASGNTRVSEKNA